MKVQVIRTDSSKEHLAHRAAAILLERWGRRVHDFRVESHAGGLILHGQAASYYTKQLAQVAAAEAAGLPVRINAIVVV